MSDVCVCVRDVISEFNSEIEVSLALCALMLFLCSIFCFICSERSLHVECDDICMFVVNKPFELLEFIFDSVYVDLQYDEISLTFTACVVFVVLW